MIQKATCPQCNGRYLKTEAWELNTIETQYINEGDWIEYKNCTAIATGVYKDALVTCLECDYEDYPELFNIEARNYDQISNL